MHSKPPAPSRDPRDAWRLAREWLSSCPALWSRVLAGARQDEYARIVRVWRWAGALFVCWPILVDIARPHGIQHLGDVGALSIMFMAVAVVIVHASKQDESTRSRLMGIAPGLSALAAAVVEMGQMHILWQSRSLGYGCLLFVAASIVPKIGRMGNRAPEMLVARIKWYMGLVGLAVLTIAMVTSAWCLTVPIGLGGDLAHPPARGLLILIVWLTAVLGVWLMGWPVAMRLVTGGLSPITADGKSRFLIGHVVGTLVLSTGAGALALKPLGHPMLGWSLGLIVGLVAIAGWEAMVRANVVLRGPGPLIWGMGLLFIAAGVRGAAIGPSQSHPVSAEFAAAILIWFGLWIERHVVREVLGMSHRPTSVGSSRAL
jgi:hypothetical protein